MTTTRGATAEPHPNDGRTDGTVDVSVPNALPDAPPEQAPPHVVPLALAVPGDVGLPPDVTFNLLPVLAYDVVTTGDDASSSPGRLVVSVRLAHDAHAIAGRLNAMQSDGLLIARDRYTVALPREITRDVPTDPATPIVAAGYALAPSALAVKAPPASTLPV